MEMDEEHTQTKPAAQPTRWWISSGPRAQTEKKKGHEKKALLRVARTKCIVKQSAVK
jgi:hypothetical protein